MQSVLQVSCKPGRGQSLRQRIVSDEKIRDFGLHVQTRKVAGRNPGWAKVRSDDGHPGAINIEWDASTSTLLARVVTRHAQPAGALIGGFMRYLLARHVRQIRAITIFP
jgi:hypothetical protein